MAKKSIPKSLTDSDMNPPEPNVELLRQIASQTGYEYADAYTAWLAYHQHPDAYDVVDTVLWIAQAQQLSVKEALQVVREIEEQFGNPSGKG